MLPLFDDVRGQSLLVALSGGADSVALLRLLCEKREALDLTLHCLHAEHGLRGEDSLNDMHFCEALCASLDVPLRVCRLNLSPDTKGLETVARNARYAVLRAYAEEIRADRIVTAHHAGDQAETVLMHLLRGCGPDGISAMKRFSGDLYRPLLETSKDELIAYLDSIGQDHRTDASNFEPFTLRNRLRMDVIPVLRNAVPNADRAIGRYARIADEENRFLARLTKQVEQQHLLRYDWGTQIRQPDEIESALMMRLLRKLVPSAEYEQIRSLCLLSKGQKLDLGKTLIAERTDRSLWLLHKNASLWEPMPISPEVNTAEGRLIVTPCDAHIIRDDPYTQVVRCDCLVHACIRLRRSGDRFHPLGSSGDKLLSDEMTDRKIERPLRDHMPLVASGNRILWIPGHALSQDAALTADTQSAVKLQWIPNRNAANAD